MGDGIQLTHGFFAKCALGNRLAMGGSQPRGRCQRVPARISPHVASNDDDVAVKSVPQPQSTESHFEQTISMMFRNRFGLVQKISRVLRVHDLHLLLTSVARDLGTDVAGGSRRRRQTENWEHRRAGDKKSGTARHSCSTPLEFCPQLLVVCNTIPGANLL